MVARLLQNFSGCRAFVVAQPTGSEPALTATLTKLGVSVVKPEFETGCAKIDVGDLKADQDIIFVDGDLERALVLEVDQETRLPPVPVIGLVGVEAPSRLKALVNLGATSFLKKPVHGGAVYTALFMGINQFMLRSTLSSRVKDLEERRRSRRAVLRATLLIMRETGLDEDQAYASLRRESMRLRLSLEHFCEDLLSKRSVAVRLDSVPSGGLASYQTNAI